MLWMVRSLQFNIMMVELGKKEVCSGSPSQKRPRDHLPLAQSMLGDQRCGPASSGQTYCAILFHNKTLQITALPVCA